MMNPIQDANVAEKSRILRTSITEEAMLQNVEDNLTQEKQKKGKGFNMLYYMRNIKGDRIILPHWQKIQEL